MSSLRIGIITGSTRPGRNNEAVARWVCGIAQQRTDAEFELVDIADYQLPLYDEPMSPMFGKYTKPHSKAWSDKIASFDGHVFVTPEYNHSIPGALKNALDFLYREWNNKAAGFVSYGGGAGGSRAVEHMRAKNKLSEPKVYSLNGGEVPAWRSAAGDKVRVVVGSFERLASPLVPTEPFTLLDVGLHRENQLSV